MQRIPLLGDYFRVGAQDTPRRREDIANEWRLYNRELVEKHDPDVYRLITDPNYKLPSRLPDGKYRGSRPQFNPLACFQIFSSLPTRSDGMP